MRGYQPQVNAVQRQFEQVQPYTSPDGLRELKAKQDHIKDMWARVNAGVQDKQKVLVQAVQHRKDFYSRLQDFEKWLKRSQRKLDTGSEIYSDEVGDVLAKLKVRFEIIFQYLFFCFETISSIYLFLTPNSRSVFRAGMSLNIHSFILFWNYILM